MGKPIQRPTFAARFNDLFFDPSFRAEDPAIERLQTIAWDNHQKSRKAPLTREAGPGFSDPSYPLSTQWLDTRVKIRRRAC